MVFEFVLGFDASVDVIAGVALWFCCVVAEPALGMVEVVFAVDVAVCDVVIIFEVVVDVVVEAVLEAVVEATVETVLEAIVESEDIVWILIAGVFVAVVFVPAPPPTEAS